MIITNYLLNIMDLILSVIAVMLLIWVALKIREVHLSINGRLDQLVISSVAEGHAAGVEQERSRESRRTAAADRETERKADE